MNKEDFYHDFLLIREMRAPTSKRYRMLGELLSANPNAWQVVGITYGALSVFAGNNFEYKSRMGINRAHIVDRHQTYTTMLEGPIMELDEWWQFYVENDQTILSTSTENMKKKKTNPKLIYSVDANLGLFRSKGFAWSHKEPEIKFLQELYQKTIIDTNYNPHDALVERAKVPW